MNPTKRKFAMQASNVLKPRKIDVHIEAMLRATVGKKLGRVKRGVAKAGIWPLQWFDMEAARITWLGAYEQAIKVLKMKPKEAITYADDIVTRTQASGQLTDIAPIQRTPMGKLLTLFQTFVLNEWNFLSKDVLGYKNPKMKNVQRVKNISRLVLSTALVNAFFEGILKIRSPFPAPEWAVIHALEQGEDDLWKILGSTAKETAEQIPIVGGGIRWYSPWRGMPWPAGIETIGRAAEATIGTILQKKKITTYDAEMVARVLGLPGTSQAMKYIRRRKKGMTHAEAILGVRTDIQQRQKKHFYE